MHSPAGEEPHRIRFTADEWAMLRQLAEAQGVTSADVLRLYIRREHAATTGEKKLATAKGRK